MTSGQWESWIGLSSAFPRTSESENATRADTFWRVTQWTSVPHGWISMRVPSTWENCRGPVL